ncbi:MAG: hypothetical protein ABH950_01740 [Candidatus Altiarchaeota archaeon]
MRWRGQVSIEFMIVTSIILLLFVIMGYVVNQKMRQAHDLKLDISGDAVTDQIASAINEVVSVGDGFSQKLVLPSKIYSEDEYRVRFFPNDSSVYVEAGPMTWSAPLYTTGVSCAIEECRYKCNETPEETCMQILKNKTFELEVTNRLGKISMGYPYELEQENNKWRILPFRGDKTPYKSDPPDNCLQDPAGLSPRNNVYTYLYEDTQTGNLSLVFKALDSSTNPATQKIHFDIRTDLTGVPGGYDVGYYGKTPISDILTLVDPDGFPEPGCWFAGATDVNVCDWANGAAVEGECEGVVFTFASPAYVCIYPNPISWTENTPWYWLNADNERIRLNQTKWNGPFAYGYPVCITYP